MNRTEVGCASRFHLLLTCEHAGNRIPKPYTHRFKGAEKILQSHQGWDPGALDFTRYLSRHLTVPYVSVPWSRLLVEGNRSTTNPRIWSRFTASLPIEERRRILETYWWPHRREVEAAVGKAVARGEPVLHIAVHTFTPVWEGVVRTADLGFLYDPARPAERALGCQWQTFLKRHAPDLRVRRNYPYQGAADGLTTWLRGRYPADQYLGFELEVNQGLMKTPGWSRAKRAVASILPAVMDLKGTMPTA